MTKSLDFLFYRFYKIFERIGYAHIATRMTVLTICVLLYLNAAAIALVLLPHVIVHAFWIIEAGIPVMLLAIPAFLYFRYLHQQRSDSVFITFQGERGRVTKKGYAIIALYILFSFLALAAGNYFLTHFIIIENY
jgi:hypothetical protein